VKSGTIAVTKQQSQMYISTRIYRFIGYFPSAFCLFCLQCFEAVGWAAGRAQTECWDAGVVTCLGQGEDLHMACLMPMPLTISCSSKPRLVLPFRCRLTRVVPDEIQEGRKRLCVRVCVLPRVL